MPLPEFAAPQAALPTETQRSAPREPHPIHQALATGDFNTAAACSIMLLQRPAALDVADREGIQLVIAASQRLVAGLPTLTGLDQRYPQAGEQGMQVFGQILDILRLQESQIHELRQMLAELI